MMIFILALPFVASILLGNFLIPYIILIAYKKRLFDPINLRKIHHTSIPRLGGVAFVPIQCCILAISVTLFYKVPFISNIIGDLGISTWVVFPMFIMLICGLVTLFLAGIADDLIGVSSKAKFVIQIIAASLFPLSGLWINNLYGLGFIVELPNYIGIPFTIFITILIINAINLMDGLDGLCSGLVAIACFVYGILFSYYEAWLHALFAFITLGVVLSFFKYNVFGATKRRRRIFMGDTGSMTLGYSLAFLAISFAMLEPAIKPFSEGAIVVAASVLIVPVFDVARVMFIRYTTNKRLFSADKNHLHHKLLRAGISKKHTMISILSLSSFYAVFNIVMVQFMSNNILLVLNFIIWIIITLVFNRVVENRLEFKKKESYKL